MKARFVSMENVKSVASASAAMVCTSARICPILDTALLLAVSICLIIRLIAGF